MLSQVLVAPFAIIALVRDWRTQGGPSYYQRVLLVMWVVVFVFSHHDWIVDPFQPAHFLRGYDWIALFLIGAPVLVELFRKLPQRSSGLATICVILAMFGFDNAVFFGVPVERALRGRNDGFGFVIDDFDRAIFVGLSASNLKKCVLLSDDEKIAYLAVTYTPLRAYFPRGVLTPNDTVRSQEQANFFKTGIVPQLLADRCVLALIPTSEALLVIPRLAGRGYSVIYRNARFVLMQKSAPLSNP